MIREKDKDTCLSEDILTYGKLDVLEAFKSMDLHYYNINEDITESKWTDLLGVKQMTDIKMIIKTRPRYPSDRLTFSIANITKHRVILFFNIWLNLTGQFYIDVVLEDSLRNFLSSVI